MLESRTDLLNTDLDFVDDIIPPVTSLCIVRHKWKWRRSSVSAATGSKSRYYIW